MMVAWTAPAPQPAEYTVLTIVPFVESHTQYRSRYHQAITCSHFRSASQKHVYNSPAVVDRCAKTNEMKRLFIRFLNAASYVYGLRFLRVGTTASTWTDQHPQSLTVAAR